MFALEGQAKVVERRVLRLSDASSLHSSRVRDKVCLPNGKCFWEAGYLQTQV
jgi:hypothetical protein